MTDIIDRFRNWLSGNPESEPTGTPEMLNILTAVENTREVEYDCGEVYNLLDQYVEMVNKGEDASELMPLVKHHLDMCLDCHEEYESLLSILENLHLENV